MRKIIAVTAALVFPSIAYGQWVPVTNANSLLWKLYDLSNAAVWFLVSLAVLYIIWNTVQMIRKTDSAERATYRTAVMWGIVGLFVIVSLWGLVNILGNTFGIGNFWNADQSSGDLNSLILTK